MKIRMMIKNNIKNKSPLPLKKDKKSKKKMMMKKIKN